MPMNKPHLEFHTLDMDRGWQTPAGYPAGIQQKILASDIDEAKQSGSRTRLLRFAPATFTTEPRLLRFAPATFTTEPFVHDHWEEVFLLDGDLTVGNDSSGEGGTRFAARTYACRPPGAVHGPFKSVGGCMLLEIHYYDESKPDH